VALGNRGGQEQRGQTGGKGNWQKTHKNRDYEKNLENAQKIPTDKNSF